MGSNSHKYKTFNIPGLNKLTIRNLLKLWALLGISGAVIFFITTIVANRFIVQKQDKLIQLALPVNSVVQDMNEVVADIVLRKANVITASSLPEFNQYIDRNDLEKSFYNQLQQLDNLIGHDAEIILSDLREIFKDYILQDNLMTLSKREGLVVKEHLQAKIVTLEILVEEVRTTVEAVTGIINLKRSKENKRLRTILELQRNIDNDNNPNEVNTIIKKSLLSGERKVQKSGAQIREGVDSLIVLLYRVIHETNKDELISIKDNEISQQYEVIDNALLVLESSVSEYPDLLAKVMSLHSLTDLLLMQLITDKDSVYNDKVESLIHHTALKLQKEKIQIAIGTMQKSLSVLTQMSDAISKQAVEETRTVTENVLRAIVIICFLAIIISIIGALILLLRIDSPLHKLRSVVSALSRGRLDARVETGGMAKDEFLSLAEDFNRFAFTNQMMIETLSRKKVELKDSESKAHAILENALVGIVHLKDRKFVSVNKKFEEMFGYSRDEIVDVNTSMIFNSYHDYEEVGVDAYEALERGEDHHSEWNVKRNDGSVFWCAISAKLIDKDAAEKGSIWLYEDISERKKNEDQLRYLANYDTLTQLPNRAFFHSQLEEDLDKARKEKTELAVMFIDLDRFKQINDSLGHDAGDLLLQEVAKRLKYCVRGSDTVARLGGDEFTIILTELANHAGVEFVAGKILASLNKPVILGEEEVAASPSIGISIFPDDGDNITALVKNADAAMYHAKAAGRNNYQYYSEDMNAASHERMMMENRLRNAIENDEFILYYQPQIDSFSRKVIGYEALIRWQNKELGLVSPADFIPLLEESGLIVPVGEWVLRTACQQVVYWHQQGRENIKMSVNLSAKQFQQGNLVELVDSILQETKLHPQFLDLEITETVFMEGSENSQQMLHELHELGVRISLDDFGTGYSSLAYLKRFPIDVIKIDRSFVSDILEDKNDAAICMAIIDIAQRLDLEVVAEGVETMEQYEYLKKHQCHTIQGFLFGRPLPAEEISSLESIDDEAVVV